MISKAKVRFFKSLQVKKYRQAEQCFIVQGAKAVKEMLASNYTVQMIAGTESFLITLNKSQLIKAGECVAVQEEELASMGSMETNNSALAIVEMRHNQNPLLPPNR